MDLCEIRNYDSHFVRVFIAGKRKAGYSVIAFDSIHVVCKEEAETIANCFLLFFLLLRVPFVHSCCPSYAYFFLTATVCAYSSK